MNFPTKIPKLDFRDETLKNLERINRLLGFREEKKGHIFDPIEVDTMLQLQALNELSLRIVSKSFKSVSNFRIY